MEARTARLADAPMIAAIYNAGISERIATFETESRSEEDVRRWFASNLPIVVVECDGSISAFAASFAYSDRCCYAGIAEFSVYVDPDHRRMGAGRIAMLALIQALKSRGYHKLVSRVFPENRPSRALLHAIGFREIGTHRNHGRLDGVWRDAVIVELMLEENVECRF